MQAALLLAIVDRTRVVILSGHSLFTEGVAARLRQHADAFEVHVVEAEADAALDRVVAARPGAVILEAGDTGAARSFSLSQLFQALPEVRIVRLDPERNQMQLLTSEQVLAAEFTDLISVLQPPEAARGAD